MIQLEHEGAVARITLDRPAARNALDLEAIEGLSQALASLERSPDLRVVVITGGGDSVFCAGADLAALAGHPEARRDAARRYGQLLAQIHRFVRPVVARVNGDCLAGGMGIMLACDLAVSASHARYFLPEGNVGMWPMLVGALLRRAVGERVALDLALTGRKVDAVEALRLGLVNRVAPAPAGVGGAAAALDAETETLVGTVARMSPTALRTGRSAWRAAAELPLPEALDHLAGRLGDLMETEDAAEGFMAFVQKRPPEWKDR